ncbi:V-type ATPase 116kDa subunit family-domain-containing protein, partial [Jimgerdemannia flammicorona]
MLVIVTSPEPGTINQHQKHGSKNRTFKQPLPLLHRIVCNTTMPTSTLFRSEEMSLIQLYIPSEVAQPTVAELGELGLVQFRDLNPDVNAFQRAFVTEIRRLDEMERQCRFLITQLEKAKIPVQPSTSTANLARARSPQEIDDLEGKLREHERRIQEMNGSHEQLQRRYLELTELKHTLRETDVFFHQSESRQDDIPTPFDNDTHGHGTNHADTTPLIEHDVEAAATAEGLHHLSLGYVTGVISRLRMQTFERVLWRSLRGNLYINSAEIDEPITDPETDELVEKNVFIIFAHGRELVSKIRKISESLGATLYQVEESQDRRREALRGVEARIEDLNNVRRLERFSLSLTRIDHCRVQFNNVKSSKCLRFTLTPCYYIAHNHQVLYTTNNTRRAELLQVAENISSWITTVKKEKAIYHVMNLFNYDGTRRCLIAEGWCPTLDIHIVQNALRRASPDSGSGTPILTKLHTAKEPPTYHRTNKITEGFQTIIDAYGIARYREVNPGLFTIITFPFLFAMMFGDVGHGFLMLCFAIWMVRSEKKLAKADLGE